MLLSSVWLAGAAHGLVIHRDFNTTLVDGDQAGTAFAIDVNIGTTAITDLNVVLHFDSPNPLDKMFNGDIWAVLAHDDIDGAYAESYLLTRPGREVGRLAGYSDSGLGSGGALKLTLDDEAAYDIHTYRDQTGTLSGPLTGSWQPSGRFAAIPGEELRTTPRDPSLLLSAFDGMKPNGIWWLYVADMDLGGTSRLVSVDLEFSLLGSGSGPAVPEPGLTAVVGGLFLIGFASWRRIQGRNGTSREIAA